MLLVTVIVTTQLIVNEFARVHIVWNSLFPTIRTYCETLVSICVIWVLMLLTVFYITSIFARADFRVLTSSISEAALAGGFVVWLEKTFGVCCCDWNPDGTCCAKFRTGDGFIIVATKLILFWVKASTMDYCHVLCWLSTHVELELEVVNGCVLDLCR